MPNDQPTLNRSSLRQAWKYLAEAVKRVGALLFRAGTAAVDRVDRHNGAVTATATVFLTIFTAAYLFEVREQRMFNYRQLAIENAPALEIGPLAPFDFGATLRTAAQIQNRGGSIEKLRLGVVIICCEPLDKPDVKTEDLKILPWGSYYQRVARDQGRIRYMGIDSEQKEWLEPALKDTTVSRVFAYVRADYTRPASPIEPAAAMRDTASFWWNSKFNQWMEFAARGHAILEGIVEQRKVFEPPEAMLNERQ